MSSTPLTTLPNPIRPAFDKGSQEGSVIVNIGPSHPATHGTIQIAMTKSYFLSDVGIAVDDFVDHALRMALDGLAQSDAARLVAAKQMTVRDTENLVRRLLEGCTHAIAGHRARLV